MLILNKEYMVFSPEIKASKSGKEYVTFTVSDSTPIGNGQYKNEYYRIKVENYDGLVVEDRQKVKFSSFLRFNCYTTVSTKDGKTYFNKEVYATLFGSNSSAVEHDYTNEYDEIAERVEGASENDGYVIKDDDLPF